jgi:hypothetical protein
VLILVAVFRELLLGKAWILDHFLLKSPIRHRTKRLLLRDLGL